MDQDLIKFYDILYGKAAGDEAYCRLAAEHEAMNDRLLGAMETMTDAQRDAVLDYLGLVAEIHSRLLLLSRNTEEIR